MQNAIGFCQLENIKISHNLWVLCKYPVIKSQPQRVETGNDLNIRGLLCEMLSVKRSNRSDVNVTISKFQVGKKKSLARAQTMRLEPLILNSI